MSQIVQNFVFIMILSFFIAKLEGNIEGPYPWARKLPTKKFKNKMTDMLFDDKPITGYHFWLFSTLFLLFHYHFLLGAPWSVKNELLTLSAFAFFMVIEDALSILLNPYFGIKKFSKKYVRWHIRWVGFIPFSYIEGLVVSLTLLLISLFL